MTKKEFVRKIAKEKKDLLEYFIGLLNKKKIPYCIIGGLAVNAYAEPVISLDLDVVIVVKYLKELLDSLKHTHKVKKFPNSINISSQFSDLRIQIQTDQRYQDFILRARNKEILGYKLRVACKEDVLQGKIWAAEDRTRRSSKRQKDLSDISRLLETDKKLTSLVPVSLKKKLL